MKIYDNRSSLSHCLRTAGQIKVPTYAKPSSAELDPASLVPFEASNGQHQSPILRHGYHTKTKSVASAASTDFVSQNDPSLHLQGYTRDSAASWLI